MRLLKWMVAAVVLVGCVPVLVPGAGAMRVPGSQNYAFTEVDGVRLWASGAAWDGIPASLPEVMTPVLVTIANHSGQKLRLTTKDFSLSGNSGVRYSALPPFPGEMQGEAPRAFEITLADYHPAVPVRPGRPAHPVRPGPPPSHPNHFWVVRPGHFHSHLPVWPFAWLWWDAAWHHRWYSSWPTRLPSEDMLRRALPDGVLDDGGTVSGFVYFQQVGRESVVELQFELHHADTGADLGVARVPFEVRR